MEAAKEKKERDKAEEALRDRQVRIVYAPLSY